MGWSKDRGAYAKRMGDYAKEQGEIALDRSEIAVDLSNEANANSHEAKTDAANALTKSEEALTTANEAKSQTDNIVANAGDSNTEIVDARLGADGKTYATVGNHLRELGKEQERNVRNTQTLQHGTNVIDGEANAPATFQLEGKTLTSLGNSDLEDNKQYVLADKNTKVKTFKEDTWKQGVTKFQRGQSVTSVADFTGKVSGSVTENPHVSQRGYAPSLKVPSAAWSGEATYSQIGTLDGNTYAPFTPTSGEIAQQLFSFNIIEQIERKHGLIPKTTLADKVQWVKDNVNKLTCNWWGKGSGPSGNKADISIWRADTSAWVYPQKTSNSNISKLTLPIPTAFSSYIDSNGLSHYLAYAPASDGVTPSTIETDYVSLDVELKSTAALDKRPILSRIATYEGKVAGSTVENPHNVRHGYSSDLFSPSSTLLDAVQSNIDRIKTTDGIPYQPSTLSNGMKAQMMFSINIVEEIERKLGKIPNSTLADKVQWCKNNVAKITGNWWGYGSGPPGNKATLKCYNSDGNYYITKIHSNGTPTKLSSEADFKLNSNYVQTDGYVHFLAYAEPSDGVTASTINTDYFECEIELKPGAELWHPNVPLYEVTQSEYDKILVDWVEADVLARYPKAQGSQHVQNPYVMAEGENLLPPFYEWADLNTSGSSVVSPYSLEVKANGAIRETLVPCVPNQTYTFNALSNDSTKVKALVYTYDANKIQIGSNKGSQSLTLTPEPNAKFIRILVYGYEGGVGTISQPMLTLGSEPKPFVPRNPSYLFAETNLRSIGDKKDVLYAEGSEYKRRKLIENVTLDGSLGWSYFDDKTGFKRVTVGASDLTLNSDKLAVTKHSGLRIKSLTSAPINADEVTIGSANVLLSIADTDSGWGESYTPSANDIKRYFNGWKYSNGTTWTSVTGNEQTADATVSLSSKPTDYTPYKLSYVLATPKTEIVKHEGAITVNGKTQVEVGSGVVVREKVDPQLTSGYYYINITSLPASLLSNKSKRIIKIFENGSVDPGWNIASTSTSHGNDRAQKSQSDYDPSAEYTVTYLVLDRHLFTSNPSDVKATYSRNLRDAHDDSMKRLEDVATKVSVLDRMAYDMLIRLKALEGGN